MPVQDDYVNFQFTSQGQTLSARALAGDTKLDFTKAVASTDNHFADTATTALALTSLENVQQTATVAEVDVVGDDDSQVKIPVTFDKSQITADYNLLTIGLYCKPADGDEQLYAVCALKEPVLMHKSTSKSTYTTNLYVIVGAAANVTIKVDPAGAVTHEDLTAILADYEKSPDLKTTLGSYALKTDLPDFTKLATTASVTTAIASIPKPDMSKYYNSAQTDAALAKKVTDNADGSVTVNGAKVVIMQQADVQKLIDAAIATATTTLKKYTDDAKQGAIDQIQPMITAEFTKRNAPSSWWNGTATEYAAITPKVADAEYDVTES